MTPLERAAHAVGGPDLHEIARPEGMATLVYTDEAEIIERRSVPESQVEAELARLNATAPRATNFGALKWRRAIEYREPLDMVCACGAKHCGARHPSGLGPVRRHDRGDTK